MLRYTIRRFFELLLTLFLIATATFFLLEAVPGDPLTERADHLPEASRTALYQRYGLDKPIMERYALTMKKMCMGDFGESFVYAGQTVTGLLKTRLPVSARLGIQQMLLGVSVGLLLGIAAAMKRGSTSRSLSRLVACSTYCTGMLPRRPPKVLCCWTKARASVWPATARVRRSATSACE